MLKRFIKEFDRALLSYSSLPKLKRGRHRGIAPAVLAAAISAAAQLGSSFLNKGGGGSGNDFEFDSPEYNLDPYYASSQATLSGLGTQAITSNLSER